MDLTTESIVKYYEHPLHIAAALNNMSVSDFKKLYKSFGIKRWPYNKYKNKYTSVGGFQDFQVNIVPQSSPKPEKKKKIKKKKIEKETETINNFDFDDEINEMIENNFPK
jgi:hypothetical protein